MMHAIQTCIIFAFNIMRLTFILHVAPAETTRV